MLTTKITKLALLAVMFTAAANLEAAKPTPFSVVSMTLHDQALAGAAKSRRSIAVPGSPRPQRIDRRRKRGVLCGRPNRGGIRHQGSKTSTRAGQSEFPQIPQRQTHESSSIPLWPHRCTQSEHTQQPEREPPQYHSLHGGRSGLHKWKSAVMAELHPLPE
jgi:hypothetical protein